MAFNFVGSPEFTSAPIPPRQPAPSGRRSRTQSLAGSVDHRLSIIDEDQPSPVTALPTIPQHEQPRAQNRPFSRRFGLGNPPRYTDVGAPPQYSFWEAKGPRGEKFEDLRNNAYIARRGGWRKLCLILWLALIAILALALGLGIGLGKHNRSSSSSDSNSQTASPSQSSTPQSSGPFPAGSYTLTTFLTSTSANCTSNPASFTCQPNVVYSQDAVNSKSQFVWIIKATNTTPTANPTFAISSANNPFSINFNNTPLTLLDAGLSTERYNFKVTVPKVVFPTVSISIQCFYNQTELSADLYTKKPRTLGTPNPDAAAAGSSSSSSSALLTRSDDTQAAYADWPHAIDISQSIGGGPGVPDCYSYNNGQLGSRITQGYDTKSSADFCSCTYMNYS